MSTDYNPFQSPETPMQPNAIGGAWPIVPFESGHQRAVITIALLAAIALIGVAGLVIACTQYTSIEQQLDGTYELSREGAALENGRGALATVDLLVAVGLIIAFSMWTHRAARNRPSKCRCSPFFLGRASCPGRFVLGIMDALWHRGMAKQRIAESCKSSRAANPIASEVN